MTSNMEKVSTFGRTVHSIKEAGKKVKNLAKGSTQTYVERIKQELGIKESYRNY